jgi:hypothetical protein
MLLYVGAERHNLFLQGKKYQELTIATSMPPSLSEDDDLTAVCSGTYTLLDTISARKTSSDQSIDRLNYVISVAIPEAMIHGMMLKYHMNYETANNALYR